MAVYEFYCPVCGREAEFSRRISEEGKITVTCDCGQPMKQRYHAPGIVFKGNGWAGKDSRASNSKTE